MNLFVFKTTLVENEDVQSVAPFFDNCAQIVKWSVDLEDCDKVLRVESKGIAASFISDILEENGYCCFELEYLPEEKKRMHYFDCCQRLVVLFFLALFTAHCQSQIITDSLVEDFRSKVACNFSRYRTVNMSWEMRAF